VISGRIPDRRRQTLTVYRALAALGSLLCLGSVMTGGAADAAVASASSGHSTVQFHRLPAVRPGQAEPGLVRQLTVHGHTRQVITPAWHGHISHARPPVIPLTRPIHLVRGRRVHGRGLSGAQYSNNWSGYLEQGNSYYRISAQWEIPAVAPQGTGVQANSTWVGIGGFNTSGLFQIGTSDLYDNGQLYYNAWVENLPSQQTEQLLPLTVSPDDFVSAQIWLVNYYTSTWGFSLTDDTTGQSVNGTETYTGSQASAEFIEEAPMDGQTQQILPMAPYQTFSFYNADVNSSWQSLDPSQEFIVKSPVASVPSAPNAQSDSFTMESGGQTPDPPQDFESAYQGTNSDLWIAGTQGGGDMGPPSVLAPGTSPAAAPVPGGYEAAFNGSNGDIWTTGSLGLTNWGAAVRSGTSPGIAALPGGGYETAFQGGNGDVFTTGTNGTTDWGTAMMAGTSPAITAVPGGDETAFVTSTGDVYVFGPDGASDWNVGGVMPGSSPSITATPGGFDVAFEDSNGEIGIIDNNGIEAYWPIGNFAGMASGTTPTITATAAGYEIAYHSSSGDDLTTLSSTGSISTWPQFAMKAGTSPAIATTSNGDQLAAIQNSNGDLKTLLFSGSNANAATFGAVAAGTSPGLSTSP
jgi:hypothetical protein